MWKYSEETQEVLSDLKEEIEKSKNELVDFGGIMTSPMLEREYCRAVGYIDGLKFIEKLIEKLEERKDESA